MQWQMLEKIRGQITVRASWMASCPRANQSWKWRLRSMLLGD